MCQLLFLHRRRNVTLNGKAEYRANDLKSIFKEFLLRKGDKAIVPVANTLAGMQLTVNRSLALQCNAIFEKLS